MSLSVFFFVLLGVLAIASAIITVTSRHPVRAAMALVFHFFMLAGLYLTLNAQFIAALQVLIYAGAIMVLVIFVIMLLNLGSEEDMREKLNYRKTIGTVLGVIFVIQLAIALSSRPLSDSAISATTEYNGETFSAGSAQLLGTVLYTDYIFQVEAIGLLLTAAIIGAVMLAKKKLD